MPVDIAPFAVYLRATRAPRTASSYERTASAFLAFLDKREKKPTRDDVEQFLLRPLQKGSPRAASTRNHELAGIRTLAHAFVKDGIWRDDPTSEIPFAKESRRDPTFLLQHELGKLFRAAAMEADPFHRARDVAIVAVLSQLGLRVHELVALDVDQVDVEARSVFGIRGKGNTRVDLAMSAPVAAILKAWIATRASFADAAEPALFLTQRTGARVSVRTIQRLISKRWATCSRSKTITPHSLRHTTATLSIMLGTDISAVGDLLRHSSLDITRRYIGLVGERRRAAVDKLAVTIPPEILPKECQPRSVDRSALEGQDIREGTEKNSIDVQERFDDAA